MSRLNKLDLIGYAGSFVSFILPKLKNFFIKEVILFGSVTRGDFDKKSDIDIFIDLQNEKETKKVEGIIKKEVKKFYNSKLAEVWHLKGIGNEFRIKVGKLEKWKLRRSVISDGIVLYGKYKALPKDIKQYSLFVFDPIKDTSKRNRLIRKLVGRREKNYSVRGLLEEINGKQISPRVIIVPVQYSETILKLFSKEKITYEIFEVWSDQF